MTPIEEFSKDIDSALTVIIGEAMKMEQKRILNYLKMLLTVNPKATLEATIDLIETTNPDNYMRR